MTSTSHVPPPSPVGGADRLRDLRGMARQVLLAHHAAPRGQRSHDGISHWAAVEACVQARARASWHAACAAQQHWAHAPSLLSHADAIAWRHHAPTPHAERHLRKIKTVQTPHSLRNVLSRLAAAPTLGRAMLSQPPEGCCQILILHDLPGHWCLALSSGERGHPRAALVGDLPQQLLPVVRCDGRHGEAPLSQLDGRLQHLCVGGCSE
jgi:hypothetical protein